jgi:predicted nucleotide-binding protein (sugar kinase/HSP70/actin superfamily)
MTIGIPKSLFYWKRTDFWETFFNSLGFKVLLSPKTNKEIVEMGVKAADPETCFSNKVFWGHVMWLDGKCDFIFVPRLKATKEELEYCPKFFALPDLAKILVKTQILTETFDGRKERFREVLLKLGAKLKKENFEIEKAMEKALFKERESKEEAEKEFFYKMGSKKKKIVLISHPYNLYDDYVNLGLAKKLEKLGSEVIFIDRIPISSDLSDFTPIVKFHWEFGQEILLKIKEVVDKNISGAIEVSSFQCGCDAVLKEFVEKEFKSRKIPFLYILIDEHTSDAGLQTRIEAFIDTLK